jgi:hypothetical protein
MARTLAGIYPGVMKIIEKGLDCVAVYGGIGTRSIKLVVFAHNLEKIGLEGNDATIAKILPHPDHTNRITVKFGDASRRDRAKLYRFSKETTRHKYIHVSFVNLAQKIGLDLASFPQYYPIEDYNEAEKSLTFRCDPPVAAALSKKYNLYAGKRIEDIPTTPARTFLVSGERIEAIHALGINLASDENLDSVLQYLCVAVSKSQILLNELRETKDVACEG